MAFLTTWGTNESNSTPTTSVTVSVTPTGGSGHLLVVFARVGVSGATITFSDNSGSNSWSNVAAGVTFGGNSTCRQGYCSNPVAGTYTVTATVTSGGFRSIFVAEYDGMASSSVLDTGISSAGTDPITSGTFTTANANDLIVVQATEGSTGHTWAVGAIGGNTGTLRTSNDNDCGMEDTTFSSTQTNITAAITSNNPGVAMGMGVGAFKLATTFMPDEDFYKPPVMASDPTVTVWQ